ncbi:MAG: M6 family metalloprotease domain-containing protein [Candidatus Lokiarchaeota archaeon]|nr:M6 family metalloprotease domain-containing protein [Candidatus Lokiarchaeota archaeon]
MMEERTMNDKTRVQVVTIVTCALITGMLALPALPASQGNIVNVSTSTSNTSSTTSTWTGHALEPARDIKPSAPAIGTRSLIVILLQFSDKTHASGKTTAYYQDLLFNLGNPLSMASYYRDNSYGRLTLTGTVTSWLTSSKTMSYYGADSGAFPNIDDNNGNIFELAREAVQKADPSVNFAVFDQDSDGFIDNLIIIHAGAGQESSGVANDIWSHQWEIQPAQTTADSGKKAKHYALFAEDSPVGTIAHEFGHVLELPDMYDYTYSGQVFVGDWALMDSGSWNGNPAGTRPSHMISWSKMQLGFIPTTERATCGINEVKNVTIIPTHLQVLPPGSKRVAVINISTGLYYTVEVRNDTVYAGNPFDQSLPDGGVLITLCNDSATEEVFYGRPGVCVVQNAQPSYPSNDHAPFDLGPGEVSEFIDPARNVKVKLLSKNATNGAYTVEISHVQLRVNWFYINSTDTWRTYEGQTYDLTITLENTGITSLTGVSGLLIAPPAGVTSLPVSTVSYGTIGSRSLSNGSTSFRVQNAPSIAATPLNFTLNMTFNGGQKAQLSLQLPVVKEATKPLVSIQAPATNMSSYEASMPFTLRARANDSGGSFSGIFKVWYRYAISGGPGNSRWMEMAYNGTNAAASVSIPAPGMAFITVRAMDKSGNIAQDIVTVQITDTIAPSVLLSVNVDGEPSHFVFLGSTIYIVAVAMDNHEIVAVDVSINGGGYTSILGYPATVNMGINGTLDGYAYPWTPSIEGNHLIRLRAVDASGNVATVEWQLTTISEQTITTIIMVLAIIVFVFAAIGNFTRRRSYRYRSRYRSRY